MSIHGHDTYHRAPVFIFYFLSIYKKLRISSFFRVFSMWSQITFWLVLGTIWSAFGTLLESIWGIPGNSENWSPSSTKTLVLHIWRSPVWYLLAIFFEGYFLEAFFCVFREFSDIWGVPLGACLETIFVFFSGSSTWGAQRVFWGGKSDHFGYCLEASGTNLGVFLQGFGVIWNTIK